MGLNSRMGVGPRSCYVPRLRQTLFRLCPLEPFWTSLLYRHQRRSSAPHRPAQPRNFQMDSALSTLGVCSCRKVQHLHRRPKARTAAQGTEACTGVLSACRPWPRSLRPQSQGLIIPLCGIDGPTRRDPAPATKAFGFPAFPKPLNFIRTLRSPQESVWKTCIAVVFVEAGGTRPDSVGSLASCPP